jgi:hypothetical protein
MPIRSTMFRTFPLALISILVLAGCSGRSAGPQTAAQTGGTAAATATGGSEPMNPIAESYVKLALDLGQHDADYVDAFYGPPEWRTAAQAGKRPLADIRRDAQALLDQLAGIRPPAGPGENEMLRLRHEYLTRQISSLAARVDMLSGKKLSFDEEAKALYDSVPPRYDDAHFQAILDRLSALLPGDGPLTQRYDAFRKQFEIPRDRLDQVFRTAIGECRRRTGEHIPFPPDESFKVEYVTNKAWAGYNWYQGKYNSVIQVNTDLPIFIDRAIDIACHEGYPGHHLYNALLEKNLVRDRGWAEVSIYPLFSPQSLIAEGTANYGIEVAFPGDERIEYERRALFPAAGIDPGQIEKYYEVQQLLRGIGYASNEAARKYLDGELSREQTMAWLTRYALQNEKRADQQIRFIEQYRSYVINYNWGRDLVREYIEKGNPSRDERWKRFERLISSPRLPSGLK